MQMYIHCKEDTVESKGDSRYRPFFDFHRIIWVLHGRLKCTRCDKNFTEIHPRFISMLPTNIAEMFPFISSTKGPGTHSAMMAQFLSLCTES